MAAANEAVCACSKTNVFIDWRNGKSVAHLSQHISHPDADDRAAAQGAGVDPGSTIMIHGFPNGWGALAPLHRLTDWTDGRIALTNAQIWALVPNGIPIDIHAARVPADGA